MIESGVTPLTDADARHPQPIDVPCIPQPRRVAIFRLFRDEPYRYPALHRGNDRVGVRAIGDAIHDRVDAGGLPVVGGDRAIAIAVGRGKVQFRCDGIVRIGPLERADVGVVGVRRGVRPEIVVALHEAMDEREILREEDGFVNVVAVGIVGNQRVGAVVRAAELHLPLARRTASSSSAG